MQSPCFIISLFLLCSAAKLLGNVSAVSRRVLIPEGGNRIRCSRRFRTFSGECTNNGAGKTLLASAGRGQPSEFKDRDSSRVDLTKQLSARTISNRLSKQMESVPDPRMLNQFTVYVGEFLEHGLLLYPENSDESLNITIPHDDSRSSSQPTIPYFRTLRRKLEYNPAVERPINGATSVVDLGAVYGFDKRRSSALRTGFDGLLATDDGFLTGERRPDNLPLPRPTYFFAGDIRANLNPVLTALHTIFVREHNELAREVKKALVDANDEKIFQEARRINGAQWQKIVFEEWYPAISGGTLSKYDTFDNAVDPTLSSAFGVAMRVLQSMFGNEIPRSGVDKAPMTSLPKEMSFFNTREQFIATGVDPFLRGVAHAVAEKKDIMVVDARRDFLFTNNPPLEKQFDIVSIDIQRGRDHRIPFFRPLRTKLGRKPSTKFSDITSDSNVQDALRDIYTTTGNIEALPGLLAEDLAEGSSLGPTTLGILSRGFRKMRNGDRLFYDQKGFFPRSMRMIPQVQQILKGKNLLREVILRNTDIKDGELPSDIFFVDFM